MRVSATAKVLFSKFRFASEVALLFDHRSARRPFTIPHPVPSSRRCLDADMIVPGARYPSGHRTTGAETWHRDRNTGDIPEYVLFAVVVAASPPEDDDSPRIVSRFE
ncbi:unnamed protein product [Lasius platythorax]|uniref:Uncharacterized protein n=1 Tax=Lasius platythorax TaxID=488582 RepID=A0AAV2PA33_9HYME